MTGAGAEAALVAALVHHQTGGFDEAAALYRHILALAPADAPALHRHGLLLAQLGRLEEADRLLARSSAADPQAADTPVNHGKLLRALGRSNEAAGRLRHGLALAPAQEDAHLALGHAERDRGDLTAAARAYGRAAITGGRAAAFRLWGGALDDAGRGEDALAPLRRAARLDPTDTGASSRLAAILRRIAETRWPPTP